MLHEQRDELSNLKYLNLYMKTKIINAKLELKPIKKI